MWVWTVYHSGSISPPCSIVQAADIIEANCYHGESRTKDIVSIPG